MILLLLLFAAIADDVVHLPAASFSRGSERAPDEGPVRRIQLSGYSIDKTEVSIAEFERFVAEGWRDAAHWSSEGRGWMGEHPRGLGPQLWRSGRPKDHPVVAVTWYEADAFCRWKGGHLPSEAQWERAACAGSEGPYPWGDATNLDVRWTQAMEDGALLRVNTAAVTEDSTPNSLGMRHVIGNVWEWTADWYHRDGYSNAAEMDPGGPSTGRWRVLRGGSFANLPSYATCTHREPARPDQARLTAGFRCAYSH